MAENSGDPYWFGPDVTVVDGAAWRVCPVGGYGCFRILNDSGQVARDVIAVHVEVSHGLYSWLVSVASLTSGSGYAEPVGDPPPKRPYYGAAKQRSKTKKAPRAETHGADDVA